MYTPHRLDTYQHQPHRLDMYQHWPHRQDTYQYQPVWPEQHITRVKISISISKYNKNIDFIWIVYAELYI